VAALTFGPWFPGGSATGAAGDSLGGWFGTTWLMGFEGGYRFIDAFSLEGYLHTNVVDALAPVGGRLSDQCRAAGSRCHGSALRLGGKARVHAPPWVVDLFAAVGYGTERASATLGFAETVLYGDEWLLELGATWRRYGLSLTWASGRYTAHDVGRGHDPIAERARHRWIGLSGRLSF
jgi:hypothetical protein